jgi:hypothetical protein
MIRGEVGYLCSGHGRSYRTIHLVDLAPEQAQVQPSKLAFCIYHLLLYIASTIRTTEVPEKLPIRHGNQGTKHWLVQWHLIRRVVRVATASGSGILEGSTDCYFLHSALNSVGLLSNEYWVPFPRRTATRAWSYHLPPTSAKVKYAWSDTSTSSSAWRLINYRMSQFRNLPVAVPSMSSGSLASEYVLYHTTITHPAQTVYSFLHRWPVSHTWSTLTHSLTLHRRILTFPQITSEPHMVHTHSLTHPAQTVYSLFHR